VSPARCPALSDFDHAWYVPGPEQMPAPHRLRRGADAPGPALRLRVRHRHLAAGKRRHGRPRASSTTRRSIRDHSEKLAITEFPQFARHPRGPRGDINAFIDAHGDTILKPLDGMGGSRIFRVRADDPNRNVIIETLTQDERRTHHGQAYLPAISGGDKRVLIIGGKVIPYSLARIPMAGETRGNLAAGGAAWRCR
jgi:glutathione synthase